jgi:hypothetical protein
MSVFEIYEEELLSISKQIDAKINDLKSLSTFSKQKSSSICIAKK